MKIIAFDGASGAGKSVLIKRLKKYFEDTHKEVRIERLLSNELVKELDELKKSDDVDMHSKFCKALINAYRSGCDRLRKEEADFKEKNNNKDLIFILDRYLLSLYAIQGKQWGISDLHKQCIDENIPNPDMQFIIQIQDKQLPEDPYFEAAAEDFDVTPIWIQNRLSYNNNKYDDLGYEHAKKEILQLLERQ